MRQRTEADLIRGVVESLRDEFATDDEDVREVRRVVALEYWRYHAAPVRAFIPILVHRDARTVLRRRNGS
jgi:hypothetical protein